MMRQSFFQRARDRKQPAPTGFFARLKSREEAQALVEMALVLPTMMAVVTGILIFGIYFMQFLGLTEGVGSAGRVLADNAGITTDPCAVAAQAVQNASSLNSSNLTYSITLTPVIGGTSYTYSGATCSSASTTTGAAGYLVSGGSAQVTATYSNCSLSYFGNLLSSGGCSMTQSVTEVVQ